jgi:transposase
MRILVDKNRDSISPVEGTEGGRRPSEVPSTVASPAGDRFPATSPDPEVAEKPVRRKFTAEYKLRVLAEADKCTRPGEIGALLRREGLYHSNLYRWRKKRDEGSFGALSPVKRGPKTVKNPLAPEVAKLKREVERLKAKLQQAETIIDVQKKVSGLLGTDLESPESGEKS